MEDGKYNLIGSLTTKPSCLQCHQEQGYKIGDISRVETPLGMVWIFWVNKNKKYGDNCSYICRSKNTNRSPGKVS